MHFPKLFITISVSLLLSYTLIFGKQNSGLSLQQKETDSLKMILNSAILEQKGAILFDLFLTYQYIDKDEAFEYAKQYLEVSEQLNNAIDIVHAHKVLGIAYSDKGLYQKSLEEYNNTINWVYQIEQTDTLPRNVIERIAEHRIDILHNSAQIYAELGDNDKAKKNFFTALQLYEDIDETPPVSSYHGIASFYRLELENYDSAVYFFEKAISDIEQREGQNDGWVALVGFELIDSYVQLGKIEKAKELQAIYEEEERQKYYSDYVKAGLMVSKAFIDAAEGRYKDGLSILEEIFHVVDVENAGSPKDAIFLLKRMQSIAEESGSTKRALGYAKLLLERERAYFSTQKLNLTKAMEFEMDTKGKERTIQSQQATISRSNQIITFISILIGLSLVIAIILYRNFQTVKKKNHKIETLIKELHHRVKNNMQVVSSLLGLQSMRLEEGEVKEAVEEGRSRIKAMAMIHQKLYLKEDIAEVDVEDYLKQLLEELRTSFGVENLTIDTQIDKVKLDIDTVLPIGLIVNELVCNSFKHAFSEIEEPRLQLSLQKKEGKTLQLLVKDNGKGLQAKEEKELNESFGLRLVTILVKQLKGKLEMSNLDGLTYHITLQLSKLNRYES